MSDETHTPARVRWARLRFQIICDFRNGVLAVVDYDSGFCRHAQACFDARNRGWLGDLWLPRAVRSDNGSPGPLRRSRSRKP